jgi:DNA adenine methylase
MTRLLGSIISWYGGKGSIKSWIIKNLPVSKTYVEVYGGSGAVIAAKEPCEVEVYNDINGDLVNLFRCLQNNERYEILKERIEFTLYSLDEFRLALRTLETNKDIDDRAWAFFVTMNQNFGGVAKTEGRWGRSFTSNGSMAINCSRFISKKNILDEYKKRFERVQIDNRDAFQVIRYWDAEDTTFYLDPPYISDTRIDKKVYEYEYTDEKYKELINLLLEIKGQCGLSGYKSEMYNPLIDAGWKVIEKDTICLSAGKTRTNGMKGAGNVKKRMGRTEVLYIKKHKNKQELF